MNWDVETIHKGPSDTSHTNLLIVLAGIFLFLIVKLITNRYTLKYGLLVPSYFTQQESILKSVNPSSFIQQGHIPKSVYRNKIFLQVLLIKCYS